VITEEEWASILHEFPAAHQVTARAKIEATLKDYARDQRQKPGEQRKQWQRIAKLLKSKAVTELCQLARQIDLKKLPDPSFVDPLADPNWLPLVREYLIRGEQIATAYADLSKPRELLYARLIRTWTEAGLRLSTSESGPLTRFLQDVTDNLFPTTITGDAIKKIVIRERTRRQMRATVRFEAHSSFTLDGTLIKGKKM
jgi:hypothetical protein